MQIEGFSDVSGLLGPGIYVLGYRGAVVYVGQSKSLYARIYSHRHLYRKRKEHPSWLKGKVKGILFDEVHIRRCALEMLDQVERELIVKYRPRFNLVHKPKELTDSDLELVINGVLLTAKAPVKVMVGIERRV